MEERDLRGIQTSGAGRNDDFKGSKSTDLSRGGDSVAFNEGLKVIDGSIREDETDFTLAVSQKLFNVGVLGVKGLSEFEIWIVFLWGSESDIDGLLYDGVLSANHITELLLSQIKSGLLDLVRCDVFKLDDEALLIVSEVFVESVHNPSLLSSLR